MERNITFFFPILPKYSTLIRRNYETLKILKYRNKTSIDKEVDKKKKKSPSSNFLQVKCPYVSLLFLRVGRNNTRFIEHDSQVC